MPLINISLKHGQTLDEARTHLEKAVNDVRSQFGAIVQRVEWSSDRSTVHLSGAGFEAKLWIDPLEVHATGDMPALGQLLSGPLAAGLKGILQRAFPKQLT